MSNKFSSIKLNKIEHYLVELKNLVFNTGLEIGLCLFQRIHILGAPVFSPLGEFFDARTQTLGSPE